MSRDQTSVRYCCPACGETYPLATPLWRCRCGSHLNLTPQAGIDRDAIEGGLRSLWRYRHALATPEPPLVSLGEGWTPLIERPFAGAPVLLKLEYMAPTGSFKDRGVAVMLNYLLHRGVARVCEDSSGNGGAALAAYAAAAGIPCRILVPAGNSSAKIIQIAAYGAEVMPVPGSRQDVADAALAEAEHSFYASHNWQAFFLEGTKTLGYELWEQLGFAQPDNIVAPTGGSSNLLGCHAAFSELRRRGAIKRLPRLFGVQPLAVAPLHAAFTAGADGLVPSPVGPTIAEGIAVSRPMRAREFLAALRDSGGATVAVGETEIVDGLRALARAGIFVEPTAAAAAAGYARLSASGQIAPGERTVLVLTGSGLKSAEAVARVLDLNP
jgi:threonine synthase